MPSGFAAKILKNLKDELAKKAVAWGFWIISWAATSIWAYVQGVRPSVIAMFVLSGGPVATAAGLYSIGRYKELTSRRAVLRIAYDPTRNHFEKGYGASDARVFVHNDSPKNPARNLRVRISRMEEIGVDRAHPQAAQFNNVPMKIERGFQGMKLPPLDNVEVFGPVTYASNKTFNFPAEEKNPNGTPAVYCCENHKRFRMTVVATANNADPAYGAFTIFEQDGVMRMDWDTSTSPALARMTA